MSTALRSNYIVTAPLSWQMVAVTCSPPILPSPTPPKLVTPRRTVVATVRALALYLDSDNVAMFDEAENGEWRMEKREARDKG